MKTAEQAHALEESRSKWAADLGAREAALKQKEEAASRVEEIAVDQAAWLSLQLH